MSRAVERLILITVIATLFVVITDFIVENSKEGEVTILGRGDCIIYSGKRYCEEGRKLSCPGVYEDFFFVSGLLLSKGFTFASIAGAIALLVFVYGKITRELRSSEIVDSRFDLEQAREKRLLCNL